MAYLALAGEIVRRDEEKKNSVPNTAQIETH
jgi:hypothetical protein